MRTFDLSPLFRSTVGFDRISRVFDNAFQQDTTNSYPPYNIAKVGDDAYLISMAVAGFGENDLEIVANENTLTVKGTARKDEGEDTSFLYRGIAGRAFERRFQLADYIKVTGAHLENGLLHIDLAREVPEALKPRKIEIAAGSNKQIEATAA
ncbi:MAG: Hsp20 family protein [Pseudomonadota bacterium]